MIDNSLMTLEQFQEAQFSIRETGNRCELVAGYLLSLHPPDEAHGDTLLNLSKALATCFQESETGYACFDLGLIIARNPDTVRRPAASYFDSGERFAESEKDMTEARPKLVIDIASTNDRRRTFPERVQDYLNWGIPAVWVIDPVERQVHAFREYEAVKTYADHNQLVGGSVLPGFSVKVADLFLEPEWYR
jgi:Uma2 family endonuclease